MKQIDARTWPQAGTALRPTRDAVRPRWTKYEIAVLESLARQGRTLSYIGLALARGRESIRRMAGLLSLDIQRDVPLALPLRGHAPTKNASFPGPSVRNVGWAKPRRHDRWAPEEILLLKELASRGAPLSAIATRLQRTYHSVRWMTRKQEIPLAGFRPRQAPACDEQIPLAPAQESAGVDDESLPNLFTAQTRGRS